MKINMFDMKLSVIKPSAKLVFPNKKPLNKTYFGTPTWRKVEK